MKITCGTDIIEISRIKEAFDSLGASFSNRIYTKKEIEYCESKKTQKYQHYAARFAAKEATFKAISKSLNGKYDIDWKDIEVENDENGRPSINLKSDKIIDKIEDIDISISHCKEYAKQVYINANCIVDANANTEKKDTIKNFLLAMNEKESK